MSAQSIANFKPSVEIPTTDNLPLNTGKDLGSQLTKFVTGIDQEQYYQNALTNNNRAYEQAMAQIERDYQTWFDSTAVQRRVQDIKAAGLNPWLALQSGGIGANGTASSGGASPGSGSSAKSNSSSSRGASSLAMLLFATARLIAAL